SNALAPFKALLQAHYPAGTPSGLRTDNPFPFPTGSEAWYGFESLGGYCLDGVTVASWDLNRLDCFVVGGDGARYHKLWEVAGWVGVEWLGKLGGLLHFRPGGGVVGPQSY